MSFHALVFDLDGTLLDTLDDIADSANSPAQCLYLGDSGVDMQTARAAGMRAVGALWGFRDRDELLRDGAELLVESPTEILDLLSRDN